MRLPLVLEWSTVLGSKDGAVEPRKASVQVGAWKLSKSELPRRVWWSQSWEWDGMQQLGIKVDQTLYLFGGRSLVKIWTPLHRCQRSLLQSSSGVTLKVPFLWPLPFLPSPACLNQCRVTLSQEPLAGLWWKKGTVYNGKWSLVYIVALIWV